MWFNVAVLILLILFRTGWMIQRQRHDLTRSTFAWVFVASVFIPVMIHRPDTVTLYLWDTMTLFCAWLSSSAAAFFVLGPNKALEKPVDPIQTVYLYDPKAPASE